MTIAKWKGLALRRDERSYSLDGLELVACTPTNSFGRSPPSAIARNFSLRLITYEA